MIPTPFSEPDGGLQIKQDLPLLYSDSYALRLVTGAGEHSRRLV
jgi:hypothetical protein